jgi:hypothetical protein
MAREGRDRGEGVSFLRGFEEWASTVLTLGIAMLVVSIVLGLVREAARQNPCFWGHKRKRYVAIRDLASCGHYVSWTHHHSHPQDARWICDECETVGEECIDRIGLWTIQNGQLVLDEKRWIAWNDRINGR